jgi:uncharacterized protein (TIGR02996 family)
MTHEDAFIQAIIESPDDDTSRLVYADWLDEQDDPRGTYLRAEMIFFRDNGEDDQEMRDLLEPLDKIWAGMVSRPPFGILVPGLTYHDTGPKIILSTVETGRIAT